jgi:hypothetical protein
MYLDSTKFGTVQAKAANIYTNDTNVPMVYLFNLGTPFRADGQDIVITTITDTLVPRTVDPVGDGTYVIYFRDPAQTTATGGSPLLVQWGGASVNVADDLTMWQNCHGGTDDYVLVVHGEETSANLIDASGNYTATDANLTYEQTGKILKAPGYSNTSYANWADVLELKGVSSFTLSMWIKHTTLSVTARVFRKQNSGTQTTRMFVEPADGNMYSYVSNGSSAYGFCDYTAHISVGTYYKYTMRYNGGGAANVDRLKVSIDGSDKTLTYSGTIPATTHSIAVPFYWGDITGGAPIGAMDELRLFTGALTENQNKTQYDNQNLFTTNGSLDVAGPFDASVIGQSKLHNSISISI